MAAEEELAALNDRLAGSKEARGVRGGLGRVKAQPGGVGAANDKFARTGWGAVFSNPHGKSALPKKWTPAGTDALYKRFTRGPVLGGTAGEEQEEGEGDEEEEQQQKSKAETSKKTKKKEEQETETEVTEAAKQPAKAEEDEDDDEQKAETAATPEAAVWRPLIEAALDEAGGELHWNALRDEVVKRRRKGNKSSGGASANESLWPQLALAHIPESYLSKKDPMVRKRKRGV